MAPVLEVAEIFAAMAKRFGKPMPVASAASSDA